MPRMVPAAWTTASMPSPLPQAGGVAEIAAKRLPKGRRPSAWRGDRCKMRREWPSRARRKKVPADEPVPPVTRMRMAASL